MLDMEKRQQFCAAYAMNHSVRQGWGARWMNAHSMSMSHASNFPLGSPTPSETTVFSLASTPSKTCLATAVAKTHMASITYIDNHNQTYRSDSGVRLDLQCAIALHLKPNSLLKTTTVDGGKLFRHFSHPHSLTLHLHTDTDLERKTTTIPVCIVCEAPIKSSSDYYYCPQTRPFCHLYTFHPQCAELPRHIQHPEFNDGSYPLFLFALPPDSNAVCDNCKGEYTIFSYSYPSTSSRKILHPRCVSTFNHTHDYQILYRKLRHYKCHICGKSTTDGFPWFCTICHQFAHKQCAIHQMSKHLHLLHHHASTQTSSSDNKTIQHFSHKQHTLTLYEPQSNSPGEYRVCDGCMRWISTDQSQFYACQRCGFYLHRDCATLPTRLKNSFLDCHELSLVYTPDFVFSCGICLQYCHGFAYRCDKCQYAIDIRCAATFKIPFEHSSHRHPLSDCNRKVEHKCNACGEELKHKCVGCEECNFYLDLRCAHLPIAVRNRFDEHHLILSIFKNATTKVDGKYLQIDGEDKNGDFDSMENTFNNRF
ncbi:uncharacterized protein LOC120090840 [Benincasa hispida]|uniref:uncharacterized protein LOC120090840 n=1 Tax=Benincasa hispida TaxID=102211 RepID=UPI001901AC7F|nr:uncharacterized protein LOC120090840 [Benincasa hispida]